MADHSVLNVYVDVVEPGRALVTIQGANAGGYVRRDGRKYYVEADDETGLGHAHTYGQAARMIAKHYGFGLRSIHVHVDREVN